MEAQIDAPLDWDDLRVFLTIARHRTLSAAARVLGVKQPTMGRRLAALEQKLGTKLLLRTPTGYALTVAGEAVLGNVERIEAEALSVARQIAGKDIRLEGSIRLTTVETLAAFVLAPAFAEFRRAHPLVELEIAANNRQLSLLKREADVALRVGPFGQADIVARKVGHVAYAIYASTDYLARHGEPDWTEGGAGHEVIMTENDLLDTVAMAWFRSLMPHARLALASNSRLIQGEATRQGIGLACLSCYIAYGQPDLIRLDAPPAPKSDLWLGVHADLRHTPRIRAFTDMLGHALHAQARRLDP